jgi:hypothetical protein
MLPTSPPPPIFQGQPGKLLHSPGALSLQADADYKPQPQPSEGQEKGRGAPEDFHPLLLGQPQGLIPLRHPQHNHIAITAQPPCGV